MCEIQLIFSLEDRKLGFRNVDYFNILMSLGDKNNNDAYGFFCEDGTLIKGCGSYVPKSVIGLKNSLKDKLFIVGHNRLATTGDNKVVTNNHPFISKRFIWVHNGVIHNYAELIKKYKLDVSTDTDSGVIGLLAERFIKKGRIGIIKAIKKVAELLEGSFSIVLYDKKADKLYYFKNSKTSFEFCLINDKYIVGSTKRWNIENIYISGKYGFYTSVGRKIYKTPCSETIYELSRTEGLKYLCGFKEKEMESYNWSWDKSNSSVKNGYGYGYELEEVNSCLEMLHIDGYYKKEDGKYRFIGGDDGLDLLESVIGYKVKELDENMFSGLFFDICSVVESEGYCSYYDRV